MADKKKILVVDDDAIVLESLQKLLVLSEFDVQATPDPAKVVEIVKTFVPDLILMDLLMPGAGGLEVCDMLGSAPEQKRIPIIIISAIGNFKDIKTIIQKKRMQGVVDCVAKPYDFKALLKVINKNIGL